MNKVKKRFLFITFLMLVVLISGCSGEKKSGITTSNLNNIEKVEISNISNTDEESQNYWSQIEHNFAKAESGYYYLSDDFIRFFDSNTRESYPLCSKPDCGHDSGSCNAFVGRSIRNKENKLEHKSLFYLTSSIYYYNGFVYLLSSAGDLVRFSPDGASREVVCKVYTFDDKTGTNLVFSGNYVYVYSMNEHLGSSEEAVEEITRYSLDGKEKDVIVQYTGTGAAIMEVKCYGNQLFFIVSNITKETQGDNIILKQDYAGLYKCTSDTGVTGLAIDEPISSYSIDEKNNIIYYYIKSKGLYSYNINSKEQKQLKEADDSNQICEISFDGQYIYMYNSIWKSLVGRTGISVDRKCVVVDKSGNVINAFNCEKFIRIFYGDSAYIFAFYEATVDGETKSVYGYIDKSEISSKNGWTYIVED